MEKKPPALEPDRELDELVRRLNAAARESNEARTDTDVDAADPPESAHPVASARSGSPAEPERRFARLPQAREEDVRRLARWCLAAREAAATDLLLVADSPPTLRIDGSLRACEADVLDAGSVARLASALVPGGERRRAEFRGGLDFAVDVERAGRIRCNLHRERGSWAIAARFLPAEVPTVAGLGLPLELESLCDTHHGLILVTGPTGSGKTTTLAALLRGVLERRRVHAITIEDPVEYEHRGTGSIVEHVQVGRDARSFPRALRAALRQDPDVILVGEMRDLESISLAVTAAETGHLVLSTIHSGDAPQAVSRIADAYPGDQRPMVRSQLSISLTAVIGQQLVPRADGPGRVAVVETMLATDAVRAQIRSGHLERLRSQLTLDRKLGSRPLEDSLAELALAGVVRPVDARRRAREPGEFDQRMRADGREP